ncbi:MAG: AAA family ATPase, partial [Nitriliruptoraceae bacterium]
MRIHRIVLEDVRGLRHAEVALTTDRVTVIEAPNETGKTTLFDALDVLLHERDRAGKKHVRALKPVDRDVATTVAAELTIGPHRLTIRKRFNKQPATELTIATPTRRQLTGDEAHDELQRLLAEHTDLALLEALRFRQGRSLDALALGTSSSLAAVLDASAGGDGVGDEDVLLARIQDEAARYHTARTRTPTKLLTGAQD